MSRFGSLIAAMLITLCLTPGVAFAELDCTDGIDNDGNLLVDCLDPGCDLQACDDGVSCTLGETCTFATTSCGGGTPTNSVCDNAAFCDGAETCDAISDCQAGTPPTLSDGVSCTADSCDETLDIVVNAVDDSLCDDGVACSIDSCDPVLDCQHVADHSQCASSGNLCGGGLICNPAFGCETGTPVNCDDGVTCTVDLCDPLTGACSYVPNHATCSNTLFCDGVEICDVFNGCEPGTPFDCSDGILCTFDSCDPLLDECRNVAVDSACEDGLFCNGNEVCDAALDCIPAVEPPCADEVGCTDDICDEASHLCSFPANDANCDNGFFCDGVETCNPAVDCQPGVGPDCTGSTFGCQTGFCNEITDACAVAPDDLSCQNGFICDGIETCSPTGTCDPGAPMDCTPLSSSCGVGFCDEVSSGCDILPQNEGLVCDDGDTCSTTDTCLGGICVGTGSMCGDGIVDAACGEQCELPSADSCTALLDLDSDGLFACEDPDCCSIFSTGCGADCKNANPCLEVNEARAAIRFGNALDVLKYRGMVHLAAPSLVNPIEDGFSIGLSNEQGVIYSATLQPGDLVVRTRGPRSYVFKDATAKFGGGVRDGLFRVRIQIRDADSPPTYRFKLKALAELNDANNPVITTHVFGVEDSAIIRATWKKTRNGWKLSKSQATQAIFPPTTCNAFP